MFFFLKKFQSCAKHIWISDHNGTDGVEGEREREGEGEGKGGRDHSVRLKKRKEQQHFVLKPQAKNAFIRTQATEPDSNSCLYMNIQRGVPENAHKPHALPRAHTPPHTRAHTHAHQTNAKKRKKNKQNQNLKTLQKN